MKELYKFDREFSARVICGVDEAGRGPLAGPVSVAAVIMPLDDVIEGIDDSKKLSESKREALYELIIKKALAYKCVMKDNTVIDEINILEATKAAMREAIDGLSIKPDLILIDAVKLGYENEMPIIKGDATSYNIAAASIIAKVSRDRLMREYDAMYPEYGFAKHKGYGTKAHIDAIRLHGACPIHRRTFIGRI